ncbi:MAG: tail completion protein gp17 [Bacillota bacterium]
MVKIIELRKAILTYLKTKHSKVYFQSAPQKADTPYVVFDLPNSIDDGSLERFVLDIDVWDDSEDTNTVETLIDSIDVDLHRKTINASNEFAFTFYRENRLSLVDDDPRIKRRKYIYQVRTYG